MSKKKQKEDNRDIFDKIGDEIGSNPAPYGFGGAAILGGAIGRKLARRAVGDRHPNETLKDYKKFRDNAGRAGAAYGTALGFSAAGAPATFLLANDERRAAFKKRADKQRRK